MQQLDTPIAAVAHWAKVNADGVFLRQPRNRKLHDFTWKQVLEQAQHVAGALHQLGIEKGDRVAILSKNCAEWFITDLALMIGGFISIPIYPTANADTINYVLNHSGSKAIFIGKLDNWQEQEAGVRGEVIRCGMNYDGMPVQHPWNQMLEMSDAWPLPSPSQDDIMTYIYTSGSTGNPKGAILTYEAYSWAGQQVANSFSITNTDRVLSYLPLAHITERCYIQATAFFSGAQIYFTESLEHFIEDLKVARPSIFISVPRLWTLFKENVVKKIGRSKLNILLSIPVIKGIVGKKIKKELGIDSARVLGCGSAPVPPSLLQWYRRIGANITEAWGMTENCAYALANFPFNARKIGTVGVAQPGCDIKLSTEGELLFKSPGMMQGYYKDEDATKSVFTEEGYFKTGDIAEIDADGYISIVGRVKDNFKTAKGKFVSPVPIEENWHKIQT